MMSGPTTTSLTSGIGDDRNDNEDLVVSFSAYEHAMQAPFERVKRVALAWLAENPDRDPASVVIYVSPADYRDLEKRESTTGNGQAPNSGIVRVRGILVLASVATPADGKLKVELAPAAGE